MEIFFYIIEILSVIASILCLFIVVRGARSIRRRKRGLPDYKHFNLFAEVEAVKSSVSVPFVPKHNQKEKSKKIINKNHPVTKFNVSLDVNYSCKASTYSVPPLT